MNSQPTKTEAIKRFLINKTHHDLASMYHIGMECQVNVAKDGGDRVEGEYHGKQWLAWTNGLQTWKSFRIPLKAMTEPEYTDSPMNFDLVEHAEGIGMTGWDWQNKVSRWVAYDFDAMTGHSEKHNKRLSESDLEKVKSILIDIPWITIRHSTSGRGLHVYVYLEPVPTNNHTEHAALARAILHQLAGITGFDFNAKVDICGGNMWVWHRKMQGTNGLTLIKQGSTLSNVPSNWKDHINVVRGKSTKNRPRILDQLNVTEDVFQQLCGQRNRTTLDDHHKDLIKFLGSINAYHWFDHDHWMLVAHTNDLRKAHVHFGYKGEFTTIAEGSLEGFDHNAWLHPMPNGAWVVRRYGSTTETGTWSIDDLGYMHCYLNKELDFETLCRINNGVEHPKGGFQFNESNEAANVINKLGSKCVLPDYATRRITLLKEHKEPGKLIMNMASESSDKIADFKDWIAVKSNWERVFKTKVTIDPDDQVINCDNFVRHMINIEGADQGWFVNVEGNWNNEPLVHVKAALASLDYKANQVAQIIGMNICQPWRIVNKPFEMEYPGNREWNRNSAQFKIVPTPFREGLTYPTWQKILDHCGKNLTDVIQQNDWCIENGIKTGAEYLKIWIASLFKEPTEPLPYLFFYSKEQNTGKSSFHEALSRLMTCGYVRADYALVNQAGFNGELHGAVLCVIEETDVARQKGVTNRVKDWVTGRTISIHRKGDTPFITENTSHWIQTSNDFWSCPVEFGDTRIVMIKVDPLPEESLIPKTELEKLLDKEACDFLSDVLALEIPESYDRLNLPVVTTNEKQRAMDSKISALTRFLNANCTIIEGHYILVKDFYPKFLEFLDADEVKDWTKRKMFDGMPDDVLYGRLTQREHNSEMAFGNIAMDLNPTPNNWIYYMEPGNNCLKRKEKVIDVNSSNRTS